MMNLEKMKQKKRTITKSRVKKSLLAATTFLCLTTPLLQTQTAYAAENTTPAITIEKPDGWKQGETSSGFPVCVFLQYALSNGIGSDRTGNSFYEMDSKDCPLLYPFCIDFGNNRIPCWLCHFLKERRYCADSIIRLSAKRKNIQYSGIG